MKALDIIKEDRKKLVDDIVKGLNEKGLNWIKEWSNLSQQHNGINGIEYKGGNKLKLGNAILKYNFNDPRWATKKQIESNKWKLKPNAIPVLCEYWKFKEEVNKETGEVTKKVPMVNFFNVYNFSQVVDEQGKELQPFIEKRVKDEELQKILHKLEKSSKCAIEYLPQDSAYYNVTKDIIVLPSPDFFKNDLAQIGTLLHEMAHSTGHKDRLDRDIKNGFGTPEYAKEELRAEIASMFLQSSLGLKNNERDYNNNQAYINSWINILQNDPNEIYRASSDADKISDYIIKEYTEIEKLYEHEIETRKENENKKIDIQSPIKEKENEKSKEKEQEYDR